MAPLNDLIGQSPQIEALREKVKRLLERHLDARRPPPILIQGETGTGKGLLAQAIHRAGPRAGGPFVAVNCAAIPETLLEAELFGFERGAFTDARHAKPGLFQVAHCGMVFLDEVGLLSEAVQGKLLAVIEDRLVRRLGSTRPEPVDVWVVAASSENLATAARDQRLRQDLYHRLSVLTLHLPPLRERGRDILRLAEHFLARACADYDLPPKTLAPDARAVLLAYPWPGNVRELGNVIERVALLSDAPVVTAGMLALPEPSPPGPQQSVAEKDVFLLDDAVRDHVLEVLNRTGWNMSRAAALLGVSRNTLYARVEKYGLRPEMPLPSQRRRAERRSQAESLPGRAASDRESVRWETRPITLLRAILADPDGARFSPDTSLALEATVGKVRGFGGRLEEVSPAGILASFGIDPVEDAPVRAAHCAMAIVTAAERARRGAWETPAVKVAIHVGQFRVGHVDGAAELDLEAKRQAWPVLEALIEGAAPNAITVSPAAAPFLERRFDLAPVDGGGRTPAEAYQIGGVARRRFGVGGRVTRFEGRREELQLLSNRLAVAVGGHGQVIGLVGEAGIGKSRLLFEFCRQLAARRMPVTCLEGSCVSYGSAVPYLPVRDLLRQHCGITDADAAEAVAEKVILCLREAGLEAEERAPFLLALLGLKQGLGRLDPLSPEAIKLRTLDTIRRLTLKASQKQPLVLAVEDLQWIDRASEEHLASLVESLAAASILLILTYRPGYQPPWMEKSYATQMAIQPLSARESLAVINSTLGGKPLPPGLERLVLEKGEGNPFFLEELARAARQQGGDAGIPDTIQGALLARIQRLPVASKELLQSASVLGHEFSLSLLRMISNRPEDPEPHLKELVRLEFLCERFAGREPRYAFKHALTQEVAYESLPVARRRAIHAAAGNALEALYAGRTDEVLDLLAHHYAKAQKVPEAIEYLDRLAALSASRYALAEACAALEEALAHVERLPEGRDRDQRVIGLVLRQADSMRFLGRFRETLDLLLRHQARVERVGDPRLAGPYYFRLGLMRSLRSHSEASLEAAARALEEAGRCGDLATMGKAYWVRAYEKFWSGLPRQGVEHALQAVTHLERTQDRWWLGFAYWVLAFNYLPLAEFRSALEAAARVRTVGESIGDPRLQAYAELAAARAHTLMGDWETAIEACQRALEISPDPVAAVNASGYLGYAYVEKGDTERAIPLLERAAGQMNDFAFGRGGVGFTTELGVAHLLAGDPGRAHELASRGLQMATEAKFPFGAGMSHRALGRIALARGALSEAAGHLNEALTILASIPARFEVGRTHLLLAELAHAQGNPDLKTSHLATACAQFKALGVPRYVERAKQLAARLAVSLPEEAPV